MPTITTHNELLAHNTAHARNHQGVLSNHENRSTNSLTMGSSDYSTAWFVKLDQYHQSLLTHRRKLQSRGLNTAPTREKNLPGGLSIQLKSQHHCKLLGHHIVHIFCTVSSLLTLEICLHLSVPLFSSKILVSLSFFYSKGIIQFVLYSFQYVGLKVSVLGSAAQTMTVSSHIYYSSSICLEGKSCRVSTC